ncbi:MAG: putative toxin-antitoxin system toxin component, PIN family [Bacteroidaceae bacterium]|nr:putative toxin-antitoxin system toxin component, PIN family [Bacteroidaceae bacterium]
MAAKFYAVLDTNVLVSSMYTGNPSSTPRQILDMMLEGTITPLVNKEIIDEYVEVLSRDKFSFKPEDISALIDAFKAIGIDPGRTPVDNVNYPDPDDIVFYEVALSRKGSFVVTGNTKHFPKEPFVVTPAEMLEIIRNSQDAIADTPK